jgi:hypothetical protein
MLESSSSSAIHKKKSKILKGGLGWFWNVATQMTFDEFYLSFQYECTVSNY